MTKHRAVLALVVGKLAEADADCGIVLQGSVAEGTQRPDSDLDLYVVCSTDQPILNDFIQEDNSGGMRLKGPVEGIDIDVGWQDVETLTSAIAENGASGWYMFSRGSVVRDPARLANRCQQGIRDWFKAHPKVAAAWAEKHEEVRKRKQDPTHPLDYPTFAEFYPHVQELSMLEGN